MYCPHCGTQVERPHRFCPGCGAAQGLSHRAERPADKVRMHPIRRFVAFVTLMVVVAASGFALSQGLIGPALLLGLIVGGVCLASLCT